MAGFNGLGQFSFTYNWQNDAANGIPITAARMDGQFQDAVNGFDLCLTRDNQGKPSASFVPDSANAYDLGSGGVPWRSGYFGTSIGVGVTTISNIIDVSQSINSYIKVNILNANTGNAAISGFEANNGTSVGALRQYSTGYTPSGVVRADGTLLGGFGAGGLTVATFAAQPVYLCPNNTQVGRFTTTGFNVTASVSSDAVFSAVNSSATAPSCALFVYQNAAPNNTTSSFLICSDSSATRAVIYSNGNVQNQNNSYSGISDLKLKQDISLSGSQWNDIKAIGKMVSKYRFKNDPDGQLQIGLIAQDLQAISPGLVDISPDKETIITDDGDTISKDIGTETLSVKYSVLYMKAIKALGEALERIEALEAKVS